MRQKRVNLLLTRRDAATLMTILGQAAGDEPGMLTAIDVKIAGKIAGRLLGLLQPRSRLTSVVVKPRPSGGFRRAGNAGYRVGSDGIAHYPEGRGTLDEFERRPVEISAVVGLCVVMFLIGRAVQKWSDGTMDAEDGAYRIGYEDGLRERETDERDNTSRT